MTDRRAGTFLLSTKLHKPRVSQNHLHRQHLTDRLNQNIQRPLTLVSAPAGYGKSTLLSYWLETSERQSAWVSLDKNDNDPRLFLAVFASDAVKTIFPGSVQDTEALLNIPSLPSQAIPRPQPDQ